MRIWEKIKVNDVVIYNNKRYVVKKIYKEDVTTYGILENIEDNTECHAPLYACKIDEN